MLLAPKEYKGAWKRLIGHKPENSVQYACAVVLCFGVVPQQCGV